MKRIVLAAALLALVSLVPGGSRTQAELGGMIQGHVVNGTTGGNALPEISVSLNGVNAAGEAVPGRRAATDAAGAFVFTDLPAGSYRVTAAYRDVAYASDEMQLKDDTPDAHVEMKVFETVTNDAAMLSRVDHLILSFEEGVLTVMEFVQLENTGLFTIVAGSSPGSPDLKPTVRLPIPAGVTEVSIMAGLSESGTVAFDELLADISPVVPGVREVSITYSLPYAANTLTLRKTLAYPTDKLSVLVPDDVRARSSALPDNRTTVFEGLNYLVLSRQGADAGTEIEIELSNLSAPPGTSQTRIAIFALAAAVLLTAVALVARRRLPSRANAGAEVSSLQSREER